MTHPRTDERQILLDGEVYDLAVGNQVTGARQWSGEVIMQQEGSPQQEQAIALDFVNGGGFSFQGLPGTFETAHRWDAATRSKPTTWHEHSTGVSFESEPNHAWQLELGGYLYVGRGRYVQKYALDPTVGATLAIVETHDLGAGVTIPGRPWRWRQKLYWPREIAGAVEEFHELEVVVDNVTEVQTLTISGSPTSGTFTVGFDGKTTANIDFDATGQEVEDALRLIPGLEQVTVVRSGSAPNFVHTVTMTAAPAAMGLASPPAFTSPDAFDTGGVTPATSTPGTSDTWNLGPTTREARCFTVSSKGDLVLANGNEVRTCSDDPLTAGDWAPNTTHGLIVAGDSGTLINELGSLHKFLTVFKEEGPFTFDEDLYGQPELPDLLSIVDAQTGQGSSYSQGKVLMPSRTGLILWDQESYIVVGPNTEHGLEGALSPGWGRVASTDVYGPQTFVVVNDSHNSKAALWSMSPGGESRPFIWQPHLVEDGFFEDVRVVSVTAGEPVGAVSPTIASNDNANGGTIDWDDEDFALDPADAFAFAAVGTTKYLKLLAPVPGVPDDATILGVIVRVKRGLA